MKLYNSLTSKKEQFKPLKEDQVSMYVCGPTVYSSPHLGNARSTVVYDLLYRTLKEIFPKVTYARNITDIDDKINAAAIERKISIQKLTKEVTLEFEADMHAIGNLDPDIEPRATEHIADIIKMIEALIERKHAYISNDHVYFSVKSYPEYGKLSGREVKELLKGARIEVSKNKKDAEDFVLWKPAKDTDDDSSKFKSPWSLGRPGWHIECSAMSTKHFGYNYDIHGGGADLKFPHHENEIAQATCSHDNANYANFWVHNGFLTVNGEKMSKSLGNFITVRELLDEGVEGRCLRLIFLTTHYRKPLDYNFKALEDSRKTLERIDSILNNLDCTKIKSHKLPKEFLEPLLDDLNISPSLAYMYDLIKKINKDSKESDIINLGKIVEFLGLKCDKQAKVIKPEILIMAKEIQNARIAKDYKKADEVRDKILAKGYKINYKPSGEVEVV
jgi:cysteinyl-tRNA synthetase